MLHERKKLLTHRITWLSLLLLGILIPIIIVYAPLKKPKITSHNGYINNYYESLNETSCEIEVTCNGKVDYAYITVAFYDANGNFLGKEEKRFWGYDETVITATFFVDGKVDSYEIRDYDIKFIKDSFALIGFAFLNLNSLVFFINTLRLSYKEYDYNENSIIIYSGFYHHYIKVNGIKFDEHNTFISWTPINLSSNLDDGTLLNATISLTNRISLKINNKLYNKRKK